MTLRELRVLVQNLPSDSATVRALRGHPWADSDYMLAELLDHVKFHRAEWAYAHGAKPPKPKPTTRPTLPDAPAPERGGVTERELARAAHQHILGEIGLGENGMAGEV